MFTKIINACTFKCRITLTVYNFHALTGSWILVLDIDDLLQI